MERISSRAVIGVVALLGASLGTSAVAGAQTGPAMCGGLEVTLTVDDDSPNPFLGTDGDDVILVDVGLEREIRALDGNDTICVPDGGHRIVAGGGDDTIYGNDNPNGLFIDGDDFGDPTQTGNDVIYGGADADDILGGPGDDVVNGRQGFDTIVGGLGDDIIRGGQFLDIIVGGPGDDQLFGGQGDDLIIGEEGRDEIFGGIGDDILFSDGELDGENDAEFDFVGLGINSRSASVDTAGSRVQGGPGQDVLIGSNRWDRMQGGDGDDVLLGLEGRDWMRGGNGNDILLGGPGIDDVNGNLGNDEVVIYGADTGHGGFGVDACFTAPGSAANTVNCESQEPAGAEWDDIDDRIRSLGD